jgi:hypothetical protein
VRAGGKGYWEGQVKETETGARRVTDRLPCIFKEGSNMTADLVASFAARTGKENGKDSDWRTRRWPLDLHPARGQSPDEPLFLLPFSL